MALAVNKLEYEWQNLVVYKLYKNIRLFSYLIVTTVLVTTATAQTNFWERASGPVAGRIEAIAFRDCGDVFVGTRSGVAISTDNGDTWRAINNGLNRAEIQALAISKNGYIFAGTRQRIFRSTNKGKAWNETPVTAYIQAIITNNNGHIFAATLSRGIYRSTDNGETWDNINLPNNNIVALSVNSAGDIFAGTMGGGVFRSLDNADTWKAINNGLNGRDNNRMLALAINSNGHIFAKAAGINLFRSINNGDSWTYTAFAFTGGSLMAINRSDHIFVGGNGGVFRSLDNGDTWQVIGNSSTIPSVSSLGINKKGDIFAGRDGVFRSVDNGETWNSIVKGITVSTINAMVVNSSGQIIIGTEYGGLFRSSDDGDTWSNINNELTRDADIDALIINKHGHILAGASGAPHMFRSTDNGETWTVTDDGLPNLPVLALTVNDSGQIFAGTERGGLYSSNDNGDIWSTINNELKDATIRTLVINASGYIFAGTYTSSYSDKNVGVFRSIDNGDTWSAVNNGLANNFGRTSSVWALAVGNGDELFAGTFDTFFDSRTGMFRSENNGDSWSRLDLTGVWVQAIVVNNDGDIFAGTNLDGVFHSKNGYTWSAINDGLTVDVVNAFVVNRSGRVFAGTESGGVFRSLDSAAPDEEVITIEPSLFGLKQNYPNPFNASTTIRFELVTRSLVKLTIFDLQGREIATLFNEELESGCHELLFNPIGLPSGVYFYRITTREFVQTRKMILLK